MVKCSKTNGKKCGKTSIPLDVLISAISHLGDKQVSQLDKDTKWRSINSLWSELAAFLSTQLPITNDLRVRKYIYTAWNRKTSNLRSHFIKVPSPTVERTNHEQPPSIPSLTKVRTRSKAISSSTTNINTNKCQYHLIEFSYEEWNNVRFATYYTNKTNSSV